MTRCLKLVESLNRPGENLTGVYNQNYTVTGKRLERLHEMIPATAVMALLVNPKSRVATVETEAAKEAAHALDLEIPVLKAENESQIDAAFATLAKERWPLVVTSDNLFTDCPERLVKLAARHGIPAIYPY